MSEDEKICSVLRAMAWERAKGDLKSMLATYSQSDFDSYEIFEKNIKDFISWVEENDYAY